MGVNRIYNGGYRGPFFTEPQVDNGGVYTQDEYRMADLGPPDPLFSTVVYICHWDRGLNNTLNCGKNYGSSRYVVGVQGGYAPGLDPHLSDVQRKWGRVSLKHGGLWCYTGDVGTTSMTVGTNDFALEAWFYYNGTAGNVMLADLRTLGSNGLWPTLYTVAGVPRYFTNSSDRITGGSALSTGWHHVIVARSSGNTRLGADGAQTGATYVDANNYVAAGRLWVGMSAFNTALGTGCYFDSVRLSIGTDRGFNGATYTTPTARWADF